MGFFSDMAKLAIDPEMLGLELIVAALTLVMLLYRAYSLLRRYLWKRRATSFYRQQTHNLKRRRNILLRVKARRVLREIAKSVMLNHWI